MRGGGVLSNRIRAGTTNSYPNLNFPPPPNPTAQNERRYRIKTAGASRTVYTVRPPRLVVPCGVGGVLSNKNTCRSDQLVVSNLNFPPPPNPTAAIIRIVASYGKSRITATTYNLFADKSTFEAKHRSYCTKVYSIQSQWILLMQNSSHHPP
jgi:hypothetical protein